MKHDTKLHLAGGTAVLLATGLAGAALLATGLHPLTVCVLLAGLAAAAAVEGTQWADNRNARAAGQPLPHEVSWRDLFNSWRPALLGAAALEALARAGAASWLPG